MALTYQDFKDNKSSKEIRIVCPLGDECKHSSVSECDAYRQSLLEEEHKRTCGSNCAHLHSPEKGIPVQARYQSLSPAEYLLKSRGIVS